jgi:hypothetical protein
VKFTITFRHRSTIQEVSVKAEKDGIFIAFPLSNKHKGEEIFLTKTDGRWVGDSGDKKLVAKIGCGIDAVYHEGAVRKHKAL